MTGATLPGGLGSLKHRGHVKRNGPPRCLVALLGEGVGLVRVDGGDHVAIFYCSSLWRCHSRCDGVLGRRGSAQIRCGGTNRCRLPRRLNGLEGCLQLLLVPAQPGEADQLGVYARGVGSRSVGVRWWMIRARHGRCQFPMWVPWLYEKPEKKLLAQPFLVSQLLAQRRGDHCSVWPTLAVLSRYFRNKILTREKNIMCSLTLTGPLIVHSKSVCVVNRIQPYETAWALG